MYDSDKYKKWYKENPEIVERKLAKHREWYKANIEANREKLLLRYYNDKDKYNEYSRNYNQIHKKEIKNKNDKKKAEMKLIVDKIKFDSGCIICGTNDPDVLVFHHRNPEEKEMQVSDYSRSKKRLMLEIEKCDVMCANCHIKLHKNLTCV